MSSADDAVEMFSKGFNCSQSVFAKCAVKYGLDEKLAMRVAETFGGGMGRMGLTCGAVTGAFMVIGLKYAKLTVDDEASRQKSIELTRQLRKMFEARHGSIVCNDLLGSDISTPEGRKSAVDRGAFKEICPKLVRSAAEIVEQLLEQESQK